MPNVLQDLDIQEISCCDRPANSEIDPITGRKIPRAVIVLRKFDATHKPHAAMRLLRRDQNKGDEIPKLSKILKGEQAASRRTLAEAVIRKAEKLAKKTGMTRDQAEAKVWERDGGRAQSAYESLPAGRPQARERKMVKVTNAQAELDKRARERMKRTGESYARSCAQCLTEDPDLYREYESQLKSGQVYDVPQPVEYRDPQSISTDHPMYKSSTRRKDDPGGSLDECPKCGEDVGEDDSFCSQCGAKLSHLTPAA